MLKWGQQRVLSGESDKPPTDTHLMSGSWSACRKAVQALWRLADKGHTKAQGLPSGFHDCAVLLPSLCKHNLMLC